MCGLVDQEANYWMTASLNTFAGLLRNAKPKFEEVVDGFAVTQDLSCFLICDSCDSL